MKIGLNSSNNADSTTGPAARAKSLEKDIAAAKRGDWEARHRVEKAVAPLLNSLACKRSQDNTEINRLLECGKQGIAVAIRKFKSGTRGDRFQIFALPYIEGKMDKTSHGGFFSRLFGR